MILSEFETRLTTINPKLRVKKYGTSMAGIHAGNVFVCRIPQGEILEHNVFETKKGFNTDYVTNWNLRGEYRWKQMTRRGRREAAQILYTQRHISLDDIAKIV